MQGFDISVALDVAIKIGVILGPILVSFWRRDQTALSRLLEAVPSIWGVVQQERRQAGAALAAGRSIAPEDAKALSSPLARAQDIAEERFGPLSTSRAITLEQELRGFHEVKGAPAPGAPLQAVTSPIAVPRPASSPASSAARIEPAKG